MLAAIKTLIAGKPLKGVQQYTIDGRSLQYYSIEQLLVFEAEYTRRCLNETRKNLFPQVSFTQ